MNPTRTSFPRITVVTPSYNQGHFLGQTIESILSQKYPNLEYIIIDGGSNDDSVAIIKRYESELTFWVSEPDAGQTDAINKGLRRATGEIVTWLNSDDLHFPETLAKIAGAFGDSPVDVVYGDYALITHGGREFLRRYEIPFDLNIMLYGVNFIGQPSAFFSRSLLDRFGYLDPSYHYAMDHEFWIRLARGGASFRHIKHCLSKYRYHAGSKTVDAREKFAAEMQRTREKYGKGGSPLVQKARSYWARIKRQLIKLVYRGRIDLLGGSLSRIWYRRVQAGEERAAASLRDA
ncbi:MAG: glycosyltransferase [Verrucomicrobiota bacterium]|nr:glycosyltransferase [Verrucomicrobiota bacterium]